MCVCVCVCVCVVCVCVCVCVSVCVCECGCFRSSYDNDITLVYNETLGSERQGKILT